MIKRFFGLLLILTCGMPGLAAAHDSSLATLQFIHLGKDRWVFEIKTPLYGLDQSLRLYLEKETGESVTLVAGSRKYKERLVEYIKSEFAVTARGTDQVDGVSERVSTHPRLGSGRLKLDNHQSSLVFEIDDMPATVEQLEFRFHYMANNDAQNNIVRLIDGVRSQRYILNYANNFEAVDNGFFLPEGAAPGLQLPNDSGVDLVSVQ